MADLGSDFSGVLDLGPSLGSVSGRRALAEAIARRWTTPHGSLFYDFDYGHDVRQYVNAPPPASGVIESQLSAEAFKDERVRDCDVSVERVGEALTIRGIITDDSGPSGLTLNVSQLTVELLTENL